MKFRFLGGGDCPDWLLTEINTLSELSSREMEILTNFIIEDCKNEQLHKVYIFNDRGLRDAKENLGVDGIKAAITVAKYIIYSALRHEVSHTELKSELLQLGLPEECCKQLVASYTRYATKNPAIFAESHRLNQLSSVCFTSSKKNTPVAEMKLEVKTLNINEQVTTVNIIKDDIPILLEELKKARRIMEGLSK